MRMTWKEVERAVRVFHCWSLFRFCYFSDWPTISVVAHTVAIENEVNIKEFNQRKL